MNENDSLEMPAPTVELDHVPEVGEAAEKMSAEQLKMLGKLSKLEDKLFKRRKCGKLMRRLKMKNRINQLRKKLNMKSDLTLDHFSMR